MRQKEAIAGNQDLIKRLSSRWGVGITVKAGIFAVIEIALEYCSAIYPAMPKEIRDVS